MINFPPRLLTSFFPNTSPWFLKQPEQVLTSSHRTSPLAGTTYSQSSSPPPSSPPLVSIHRVLSWWVISFTFFRIWKYCSCYISWATLLSPVWHHWHSLHPLSHRRCWRTVCYSSEQAVGQAQRDDQTPSSEVQKDNQEK